MKKMMDPTLNLYTSKEYDFNSSVVIRDLITIFSSLGVIYLYIKLYNLYIDIFSQINTSDKK